MKTTHKFSTAFRIGSRVWVATARALQPQATTKTVLVVTNEGNNQMANAIRKRIALAAAVAVSAGLLSAVPAQATGAAASSAEPFIVTAAEYVADSAGTAITGRTTGALTDATVTVGHPAGAANFVEITADTNTASSAEAVRIDVTGSTIVTAGNTSGSVAGTINTARTSVSYATNAVSGAAIRFAAAAAGTFTVKVTSVDITNGIATDTALQTFNVTVNAAAVAGKVVAAKSTSITKLEATASFPSADEAVVASAFAGATAVADVEVKANDANGVAVTGKVMTASISGPGLLGVGTSANPASSGRAVQVTLTSTNTGYVSVYADGTSGVATITIAVDGVVVGTEKVTFYGKTAKLTVTVAEPHIVGDGVATDKAVSVVATDANGVAVAGDAITITTDGTVVSAAAYDAGSATDADGKAVFDVTAANTKTGAGTVTFTSASDTTVKATANFTATGAEIASLVLTSNKASYSAGEKITLTLTAKDANGVLMGKKAFTGLFTGTMTASSAVVGTLFGADVTFSAGVATVDVYAPLAAGALTFTSVTTTSANTAAAEDGKTKSLTVAISGSADIAQIKADLAALQKSTSDLIAALSAQVSYLRKQLNQLLKRR